MMKVAVLESLAVSAEKLAALEAPLAARGCEFVHYERTADAAALANEVRDAEVLILANMPLPAELAAQAERLKYVDVAFTGVDHVPMDLFRARGIAVSNASGYSNEAVPELAVGMVLSILRNLREVERACRAGGTKAGLVGTELKGKTVGILGYGSIGSRSGELFHAFGCRIVTSEGHRIKNRPDFLEVLPVGRAGFAHPAQRAHTGSDRKSGAGNDEAHVDPGQRGARPRRCDRRSGRSPEPGHDCRGCRGRL